MCILMRQGATVVDFAYHLHTDVGNQMKGAKVNGVHVPPDHKLSNAEVVEIVMDAQHPQLITAQDVLAHKVHLLPLLSPHDSAFCDFMRLNTPEQAHAVECGYISEKCGVLLRPVGTCWGT